LRARHLVSKTSLCARESHALNRSRRSLDRERDVFDRRRRVSFRKSAFLFPESVFFDRNVAFTIESDALAIVGATFGSSNATARFQAVAFEPAERRSRNLVTRLQLSERNSRPNRRAWFRKGSFRSPDGPSHTPHREPRDPPHDFGIDWSHLLASVGGRGPDWSALPLGADARNHVRGVR
jgi:hypothetical protein